MEVWSNPTVGFQSFLRLKYRKHLLVYEETHVCNSARMIWLWMWWTRTCFHLHGSERKRLGQVNWSCQIAYPDAVKERRWKCPRKKIVLRKIEPNIPAIWLGHAVFNTYHSMSNLITEAKGDLGQYPPPKMQVHNGWSFFFWCQGYQLHR